MKKEQHMLLNVTFICFLVTVVIAFLVFWPDKNLERFELSPHEVILDLQEVDWEQLAQVRANKDAIKKFFYEQAKEQNKEGGKRARRITDSRD